MCMLGKGGMQGRQGTRRMVYVGRRSSRRVLGRQVQGLETEREGERKVAWHRPGGRLEDAQTNSCPTTNLTHMHA